MALAVDSGPSVPALPSTPIGRPLEKAVARWGDRQTLVSVEQGLRFTHAELAAAVDRVAAGLAAYIRVTGEFPMTVTDKIQKYKMRDTSIEELQLQDAAAMVTA